MKCPFLNMPESELSKLKPQYQQQVAKDATKCIDIECSSFNEDSCMRQINMPVFDLKLGLAGQRGVGVYQVEESMLKSNLEFSSIFGENSKPKQTILANTSFTLHASEASEIPKLMQHLLDGSGNQLVISKRSYYRGNS